MLDITDPHWSTWPACVAVKAAELQGRAIGDRFLRRLRRAALTERAQAQRTDVQLRLAAEVTSLDVSRFEADLKGPAAAEAFRRDRAEGAAYGASGFLTMLFRLAPPNPRRAASSSQAIALSRSTSTPWTRSRRGWNGNRLGASRSCSPTTARSRPGSSP
jgi:protein-disulfide isomerase-like protein with CxxC motif